MRNLLRLVAVFGDVLKAGFGRGALACKLEEPPTHLTEEEELEAGAYALDLRGGTELLVTLQNPTFWSTWTDTWLPFALYSRRTKLRVEVCLRSIAMRLLGVYICM